MYNRDSLTDAATGRRPGRAGYCLQNVAKTVQAWSYSCGRDVLRVAHSQGFIELHEYQKSDNIRIEIKQSYLDITSKLTPHEWLDVYRRFEEVRAIMKKMC